MTARRFQPGGTLREDAFYAEREADGELLAALLDGETCSLLAPRQIGKSSLRVRTSRKLREGGLSVATIDLTRIGGRNSDVSGWYFGLMQELASRLSLADDPAELWKRYEPATPVHRFVRYLRERVLAEVEGSLVIFFDEIDSVLSLPFGVDDFFAALRDTYNARADDPAYQRLSLCLMGVAAPSDLAREPARTPFNVGRSIRLEDFTRVEAAALLPGLHAIDASQADGWLDRIYDWTAGHPYMMQKLCAKLADGERDVDALVESMFLRHGRSEEPSLEYAERRLLADKHATQMLRLYERLLAGERVEVAREDAVHHALRLTGMAAEHRAEPPAVLRVRNRIYQTVFDAAWLRDTETARLISEPLARWLAAGENDDFVLRGQALDEAQAWARERTDLSAAESRFLLAGMQVARKEEAARSEAERERERRGQAEQAAKTLRRNLAILVGLVLLLAGSLGVAIFQYRAARRAQHAAEAATRRERGVIAQALSQQIGQEIPALHAGIEAVAPVLALGEEPPATSVSGLAAALFAADYSRRVDLPPGTFTATEITPDGRRLVAASSDKRLRVWSLPPDERAPLVLRAAMGLGQSPRFTGDGRVIMAPADGGELRSWDRAGAPLATETARTGNLLDAVRLDTGATRLLTIDAGALAVEMLGQAGGHALALGAPAKSGALSPDGKRVCAVRKDHGLAVLDAESGALVARLDGTGQEPRGCSFSSSGNHVVTTAGSTMLRFELPAPGTAAVEPLRYVEEDEANSELQAAAVSPDGRMVAFSGRTTIVVLDAVERKEVSRLAAPFVTALAFSADGRWVAGGRRDGRVELMEARPNGRSWSFRAHSRMLLAVAFAPDGRDLMTASVDGSVRLFPVEPLSPTVLATASVPISCLGVSPDGERVVHGGAADEVVVRALDDGREIVRLRGHAGGLTRCRFSPDGSRIMTAGDDRTLRLWNAETGALETTLETPESVADAVFAPDGGRLAASFVEGPVTLRFWDLATGAVYSELPTPSRLPATLRFSDDGERLFVGGPDGNVAELEASSRRTLRMFNNGATTSTVSTSTDGSRLLVSCADATAHVWSVATGQEQVVLRGRTPLERPVRFTPDGTEVYFRGVVQPMPTTASGLLRRGCALLAREGELDPVRGSCTPYLAE